MKVNSWSRNYSSSSDPLNLENVERGKKSQKFEYLKNKESFVDEIKSIFHNFWNVFFCWNTKNRQKKWTKALSRLSQANFVRSFGDFTWTFLESFYKSFYIISRPSLLEPVAAVWEALLHSCSIWLLLHEQTELLNLIKRSIHLVRTQNFLKNQHFLPLDTHTYVCVSRDKK